jgi:serine/threonine protein kinase
MLAHALPLASYGESIAHIRLSVKPGIARHCSPRPIQNARELLEDSTVTQLAAGVCLGPYRIESKLGEGGMGEVFRAFETRLGRAVAVKITHERF